MKLTKDDLETMKDGLQNLGAPSMYGSRLYELWKHFPFEEILENQEKSKKYDKGMLEIYKSDHNKIVQRLKNRIEELNNEKIIRGTFAHEDTIDIRSDIQDELQKILSGGD